MDFSVQEATLTNRINDETNAVTFEATIDGQRTDRDGETKLVLLIPDTDRESVKKLLDMGSKRLGVAISIIGECDD